MIPKIKGLIVSILSAVVGGVIVVIILTSSPALRSKLAGFNNTPKVSRDMIFDDILSKQKEIHQKFDNIFNDDIFGSSDPFEDMKKIREQMRQRIEMFEKPGTASNPFDTWFSDKFGGGTVDDITKREDDDFVYYDLKINDLKSTSLNTNIENGYITITGTIEKKTGPVDSHDESATLSQSFFKSTFNRTFQLPEHVDQNKMEMVPEKDKVVLKFPKIKI